MATTPEEKRAAFHALHAQGCFVIPNPWDVGSAKFLQGLGFKALATTSSGFAWSHGHRDGGMSRDRVLDHLTEMVEATDLPINADFEHGFSPDAAGVADSVRLAVETGVAGLSIEDSTGDAAKPLFDFDIAVDRMRAARKAIDKAGSDTMLIGFNADLNMPQIAALGVRRVSVGGALARAAWGGFMRASKLIIEQGKFDGFSDAASGSALNTVFRGN